MDDIERMYRHLVRTIRANFAPFLTKPFEVGELYQTILPYRLHRRELGFETNQDYETAMLELLSGARGYLVVDDKMRDVLSAEQSAPNPDPGIVRDFAASHVALAPEPLRRLEIEGRGSNRRSPPWHLRPESRAGLPASPPRFVPACRPRRRYCPPRDSCRGARRGQSRSRLPARTAHSAKGTSLPAVR
jgi:hypothetical protein